MDGGFLMMIIESMKLSFLVYSIKKVLIIIIIIIMNSNMFTIFFMKKLMNK